MARFSLDDIQADAIVKMRLGQLSGLEREKILAELLKKKKKIKDYTDILSSNERVKNILINELTVIKNKFGDGRRTDILKVDGEVDIEDLIPQQECVVTLTHYGYIKRQPADDYKIQKRGGRGVSGLKRRDEDFVENLFIGSSHYKVIFVTSKGVMYCLKCYEIPQGGKNSKGVNIANLLNLSKDESITNMFCIEDFSSDFFLVFVTKFGMVKRTRLDEYKNIRKNGLIALSLKPRDRLVNISLTTGKDNLLIATKNGMAIRFAEDRLRPLSRSAIGVLGIRLKGDDEVVGMIKLEEFGDILTVSSTGKGRRTAVSEYRLQNRGGSGILNYRSGDDKGVVVGVEFVKEYEDLILISLSGVIIRIAVTDISKMSRYGVGVRLINLKEDDSVVAISKTEQSIKDSDYYLDE